jgi:hypothetical protein
MDVFVFTARRDEVVDDTTDQWDNEGGQ